jgi:tripartite-type tricarboxylate transporter receptor subunit TctC
MVKKKNLVWLGILFSFVFCITLSSTIDTARGDDYPKRDITVIIPWPAGGGTDMVTRAFFKNAQKIFPVNVQLVNMQGGGGITGQAKIATSKPDGYTIGMICNSSDDYYLQGMTKHGLLEDFTILCRTAFGETVLVVGKDSPFKTLKDFMDKAKANPGSMSIGIGGGKGCCWHMPTAKLMQSEGTEIKFVPLHGGAPARTAAMGGHVDASCIGIMEADSFLRSGDLRCLGIFAEERNPFFPDIPTVAEQGYEPAPIGVSWGLVGPKGIPQERVDILLGYLEKCFNDPEYREILNKKCISLPKTFVGGEQAVKYWTESRAREKEVLTDLGMCKVD